ASERTIEPINHIIIIGRCLRSRFIYACLLTQPRACGGCRARPNRLTSLETRDLRSHKWVIPSLRGPWVQIPPPAPPPLLNQLCVGRETGRIVKGTELIRT